MLLNAQHSEQLAGMIREVQNCRGLKNRQLSGKLQLYKDNNKTNTTNNNKMI
jgi:hypothetical protein